MTTVLGCWEREHLPTVRGKLVEPVWRHLKTLKTAFPWDPAVSLLAFTQRTLSPITEIRSMFSYVFCCSDGIARIREHGTYTEKVELIIQCAGKWMELGKILNKVRQAQEDEHRCSCMSYLLLFTYVYLCGGQEGKCLDTQSLHERGKKTFNRKSTYQQISRTCVCAVVGTALAPRAKEKKDKGHAD